MYWTFDIECSGTKKITMICRDAHVGRPELPTIIATKEWQPMPTPKDGVVKTDSKTYPESLSGKMQLANKTHFDKFVLLNRLDEVHHLAKPHKKYGVEEQPPPQMFAEYLQDIFALKISRSNLQPCSRNGDESANVPLLSMGELDYMLSKMKNGRCAHNDGFLADMLEYASVKSVCWNWSMILSEQGMWNHHGITAFSSLLPLRLRRQLDYPQSVDRLRFETKTGVDHAFVAL